MARYCSHKDYTELVIPGGSKDVLAHSLTHVLAVKIAHSLICVKVPTLPGVQAVLVPVYDWVMAGLGMSRSCLCDWAYKIPGYFRKE